MRCESIVLQSYWVLVVMDQFTRRLVGFGVHRGPVDAPSLCRMCNAAIHGRGAPRHLSTDHDPLFEAHRWTANLGLLEIDGGVRKARIRRDAAGRCGGGLGGTGRWRLADCVKSSPGLTGLGSLRHFGCERLHYERVVEVVRDITGRGHALDERHEVVLSRPGTQYRVYVLEGGDDV